jgi:hypothetical protein
MHASARAALAAALLALAAPAAIAQVLYKWTDRSGRVVYSDKLPPKGFDGTVTPVEPDVPADAAPPAVVRDGLKRSAPPPSPRDIATQRRDTRERLQANIDAAGTKLEAARLALAEAEVPGEDDRRVIQQRQDGAQRPITPMPADVDPDVNAVLGGVPETPLQRPNCKTTKAANGRVSTMCSRSIPTEEYYARVEKLEQAVREAQAQLDAAQEAYRRGVD